MTIPATIAFFFLSSPELELVVFFAGVAGFGSAAIGADAVAGGADAVDFFAFFEAFFSFLDTDGATAGVVVVVGSVVGAVVGFVVVVGALIVVESIEFESEFQSQNVTQSFNSRVSRVLCRQIWWHPYDPFVCTYTINPTTCTLSVKYNPASLVRCRRTDLFKEDFFHHHHRGDIFIKIYLT